MVFYLLFFLKFFPLITTLLSFIADEHLIIFIDVLKIGEKNVNFNTFIFFLEIQ